MRTEKRTLRMLRRLRQAEKAAFIGEEIALRFHPKPPRTLLEAWDRIDTEWQDQYKTLHDHEIRT